jgi:hypothetical protein
VFSPGAHRLVHDHWRVRLPFARGGELGVLADGDRVAVRYRRLFR